LSGCALLSTPVDLLTFFFRCKSCASVVVALNKNSAPSTQSATALPPTDAFDVAQLTVRPKPHLSRWFRLTRLAPRLKPLESSPVHTQTSHILPSAGTTKYTLNQRSGGAGTLPFRTGPGPPASPSVMHDFNPPGCLASIPRFYYFQRNVTMFRPTMATIRPSRFRGAAAARPLI
jgi:hypothetical protein